MATDSYRSAGTWRAVASLASSLGLYAVLAHYAAFVIGATLDARAAVTIGFLLSAALGAIAGRARVSYRTAELGLVAYAVALPLLLPWVSEIYVGLVPSILDASVLARNVARLVFAILVFAVPGLLVGVTIASLQAVGGMIAGAALGLLAAAHIAIPSIGLAATAASASVVKLALSLMPAPAVPTREIDDSPARIQLPRLPWRALVVAVSIAAAILAVAFFRSLLALTLQHPAVLPAGASVILVAFVVLRRGFELSRTARVCLAALASGAILYALAASSPHRAGLLLAVAIGGGAGARLASPRRWVAPAVAAAGACLLAGIASGIDAVSLVGAAALGVAFSAAAYSVNRFELVCASGIVGTVAAMSLAALARGPLVPLPLESRPADDDVARAGPANAARIGALFTPARARALAASASVVESLDALGFETIVCASEDAPTCLQEDVRSVLLESPSRYDVIAIDDPKPRELHRLASERLRRRGVMILRLPVRRLPPRRVFLAVNTARSVFPHVSLWLRDESAFVVASNEPQLVDLDSIRSEGGDASFVSGSPLELLRHLVVVSDDMNGFLESVASLLDESREAVSTDDRPMTPPANVSSDFVALQNRAIFDRFRSEAPFGFRGAPSSEENLLARAAFSRGSLPALARAWHASPRASLAASAWLYDELGAHEAGAIRANLDRIAELTATTAAVASCRPIPRFVSRIDRVALSVLSSSGDSLDGTEPVDAIDGTFDPFVGNGWRARPQGRPVSLDVELASPARIGAVHVVVRPIDGDAVGVRLFARDSAGRWLPLATGDEPECDGARAFQLRASSPELTALRVELAGGSVALHELWAEAS